jgi:peptidoglycan/LPS O-acetylase OafA/YrhL
MSAAPRADFRSDINGLRGLAVLVVVLYHFRVPGFSGGYVGVDVFFVISGYLMTQIIAPRVAAGRFSVLDFYMARARRIVPALLFLALALLACGLFLLTPHEYRALGKHAAAAASFLSNFSFWLESGYFDPASHEKWLLHTWSLSVEWQFYMVFPLVVLVLARVHRSGVVAGLLLVGAASFAVSVLTTPTVPWAAFFLLPARAWELLAGGMVFLLAGQLTRFAGRLTSVGGLALVLGATWGFTDLTPFPGYLAAIPVLGAALVIAGAASPWLQNRPLQFLGDVSYSLYLWHWPFWVGARYFELPDGLGVRFAVIAAAVAASWLSYRFVETPFRRKSTAPVAWSLSKYAAAAIATAGIASGVFLAGGISYSARGYAWSRDAEQVIRFATGYDYSTPYRRGKCLLLPEQDAAAFAQECFGAAGAPGRVLLWGDSHAAHLYPALLQSAEPVAELTASACPPFIDYAHPGRPHCFHINQRVLQWVRETKPATAVLAAYWLVYRPHADIQGELARTARLLKEYGVRNVVVVGPAPSWIGVQPVRLYGELYGKGFADERAWRGLVREGVELDASLKRWAAGQDVRYVSLVDILCVEAGCLRYFRNGPDLVPVQWDDSHFTEMGARFIAPHLLRALQPQLLTQPGGSWASG